MLLMLKVLFSYIIPGGGGGKGVLSLESPPEKIISLDPPPPKFFLSENRKIWPKMAFFEIFWPALEIFTNLM